MLQSGHRSCATCSHPYELTLFHPPEPRVAVVELAGTGPGEELPCAQHARNRAEAACARCGQFMCGLCRIDSGGMIYCPACFERLSAEGTLPGVTNQTWNWRSLGVLCALSCVLLFWTILLPAVGWIAGIVFCVKGLLEKKSKGDSEGVAGLYLVILLNLLLGGFGLLMVTSMLGGLLQ